MQVYRRMDVGTAKASEAERALVPHHLIDVVEPWESWSASRTQTEARAAIEAIEAHGRRALLVGGTGLYLQAVIDALRFPGEDLVLRARLEAEVAEPEGLAGAYARLATLDPQAAARIEPANTRRIVRALEVIELTGAPFSASGPGVGEYGATVFPVRLAGLSLATSRLGERIAARFAGMRAAGLLAEVEALAADPRGWSRTARQAIGYKEVLAHLQGFEPSLDGALDAAVRRTRSFARRQRAWFRRDPRITWFNAECGATEAELLAWWCRP